MGEGGHSGPPGEARGLFRRQKDHKESMAQSLVVFPAGKARQERLGSLTNVSGLWAVGVVSGFLVLGPGLI